MGIWYRTGTVTVVTGDPNIVGVGTLMLTQAAVGDIWIGPDLAEYEITSITDDTHWAVKQKNNTAGYAGSSASAQPHAVIRNFTSTLPAQLASQLAAMMTSWHDTTDDLANWLGGTGSVVIHDAAGVAHTVKTPAALESAVSGRLSKSVAGGADVTLSTTEASNLILDFTGVLTGNINVIVPASARIFNVFNNTTGAFTLTVKTPSGTGVAIKQGTRQVIECDATNVVAAVTGTGALNVDGVLTTKSATWHLDSEGLQRRYLYAAGMTVEKSGAASGQLFSFQASGGAEALKVSDVGIVVSGANGIAIGSTGNPGSLTFARSSDGAAVAGFSVSGNDVIYNNGASGHEYHKVNSATVTDTSAGSFAVTGLLDLNNASSGQIKFPATQNASSDANTLDDYEEGTWTPGVSFGSAVIGQAYSIQAGQYTKIGRLVNFSGTCVFSNKGSSTGDAYVFGLPFNSMNDNIAYDRCALWANKVVYTGMLQTALGKNDSTVRLDQLTEAGNYSTISHTSFSNDSSIQVSGHYII